MINKLITLPMPDIVHYIGVSHFKFKSKKEYQPKQVAGDHYENECFSSEC